jgi:hypothetical protein
MQADRNAVDVAAGSADGYLSTHGYWLQASVASKDSTIASEGANHNGATPAMKEKRSSGEVIAPYYFPDLAPPMNPLGPLVEDDNDEENDADDSTVAAYEYYFQHHGSCVSSDTAASHQPCASAGLNADHSFREGSLRNTKEEEDDEDVVPCLEEESLGDLGDVIGYGGDRGSFVCRVPFPPKLLNVLQQRAPSFSSPWSLSSAPQRDREAYKRYPTQISADELSFVSTAYRCACDSSHCQSARSPFLTAEEAQYAALHLVLPEAIVVQNNRKVGLLMPLYNCSLKEFLQSLMLRTQPGAKSAAESRGSSTYLEDTFSEDSQRGAFNTVVKYRPVDSMEVISSIAFQVLEAIAYLNHRLPHGSASTGYTHNDLHLDNVLLSYDGDVALCDFELVASTPVPTLNTEIRRLPPSTRQSPHGLFSETADIWAFGLILVGLLTGVDPLFTTNIVNDFSDGPLLSRWDSSECVLDWESNIKAHVEGLVRAQDPTGRRLSDASGILAICGKCLVNRKGAEPLRAVDLLEDPLFQLYRKDFRLATRTIKAWTADKRW